MPLQIDARFSFETEALTDILLQFEAANLPEQTVRVPRLTLSPARHRASVPAQDAIGERIWIRSQGRFDVAYQAEVAIHRLSTLR